MSFNKIEFDKITDRERGYILGLFIGDGYAYYDKKQKHYTVEFYLHSERNKDVQKYLISIMNKLNLSCSIRKDKRFKCNRIRTRSKLLMEYLKTDKKGNSSFEIGYLSGIIDSEGYVNHKKRVINIVNTDKYILDRCSKCLSKLNIDTILKRRKKSKKDVKKSYILYIPYKLKHISTNSVKVNSGGA
ncbi:MAG: LAGLIDADG family homing endonuclease [Candidatus Aenigmatarchaeota archaeon]